MNRNGRLLINGIGEIGDKINQDKPRKTRINKERTKKDKEDLILSLS